MIYEDLAKDVQTQNYKVNKPLKDKKSKKDKSYGIKER